MITFESDTLTHTWLEKSFEGIPGFVRHVAVSTRTGPSLDRVIDLTTTEQVQQPAYGGAAPATQTIVLRSREKRRLFSWGEETFESSTYRTASAAEPSHTAKFYWYDVPPTDPNHGRMKVKCEPDGRWEAFFHGVEDTTTTDSLLSGTVTGWTNTPPPLVVVEGTMECPYTNEEIATFATSPGYSSSITSTRPGERPLRFETYENGQLTAKSEDLTPD